LVDSDRYPRLPEWAHLGVSVRLAARFDGRDGGIDGAGGSAARASEERLVFLAFSFEKLQVVIKEATLVRSQADCASNHKGWCRRAWWFVRRQRFLRKGNSSAAEDCRCHCITNRCSLFHRAKAPRASMLPPTPNTKVDELRGAVEPGRCVNAQPARRVKYAFGEYPSPTPTIDFIVCWLLVPSIRTPPSKSVGWPSHTPS